MPYSDLESKRESAGTVGDAGYLWMARVFLVGIELGSFTAGEVPGSGH